MPVAAAKNKRAKIASVISRQSIKWAEVSLEEERNRKICGQLSSREKHQMIQECLRRLQADYLSSGDQAANHAV